MVRGGLRMSGEGRVEGESMSGEGRVEDEW